jgi:hypothetical protein
LQFFIAIALIGSAIAYPVADDAPRYGPSPALAYKVVEPELPPQPYQYEYGVSDQYSGANYQAVESQDPAGTVLGKIFT